MQYVIVIHMHANDVCTYRSKRTLRSSCVHLAPTSVNWAHAIVQELETTATFNLEEEEEEEKESLFKVDAVNEEDSERDRATQV